MLIKFEIMILISFIMKQIKTGLAQFVSFIKSLSHKIPGVCNSLLFPTKLKYIFNVFDFSSLGFQCLGHVTQLLGQWFML